MDYSADVWGFCEYNSLDVVQHKAMRFSLGVSRFTPINALYGDIGWLMPKYHRWLSMVRLWNRFVSLNDSRLTRAVFLQDVAINTENWSSEIQDIFTEFGLEHIFNTLSKVHL